MNLITAISLATALLGMLVLGIYLGRAIGWRSATRVWGRVVTSLETEYQARVVDLEAAQHDLIGREWRATKDKLREASKSKRLQRALEQLIAALTPLPSTEQQKTIACAALHSAEKTLKDLQ